MIDGIDTGFRDFLLTADFFYVRPLLFGLRSDAILSFYYLVYKYTQALGITEQPWVYLASEKEVTPEQAQLVNAVLAGANLWQEAGLQNNPRRESLEARALALGFGLEPAPENSQKIIIRINLATPGEPKMSLELAKKKYDEDTRKEFGQPYRRLLEQERAVLDAERIPYDHTQVTVYSAQGQILDRQFLGLFRELIAAKLGHAVTIDLDHQVVWLKNPGVAYSWQGKAFVAEIDKNLKQLVSRLYYGNSADNLDAIKEQLPKLSDANKHLAYSRLALVVMILPQVKPLLDKVSLLHK